MTRISLLRFSRVVLTLVIFISSVFSTHAQSGMQVKLYGLQADSFPDMSCGMDVYNAAGNFVTGLQPENVTLLEDNQLHAIDELKDLQLGVQFVVVLNTGPTFGRRDAYANTRLDIIRQALTSWAAGEATGKEDDLSLVATGAVDSTHAMAGDFLEAVSVYQPDPLELTPSFETLSRALDLFAVEDPPNGQKRAVLFISSLPEEDINEVLQSMTARAIQLRVRIFVWIVAEESQFSLAGATALKDVALQTGGQYVTFSGTEALPSLETYLAPLRQTYAFHYTSSISTSGSHTITVSIEQDTQAASAEPLIFELDVQPPNPILISPPNQILRQPPDEMTTDLSAFIPSTQAIEILVEFPDAHPRPLVRTALYVDGQKVAEKVATPFDEFTWDLSMYTASGQHIMQVEAVDSLGLGRISLGVPITVTVLQPQSAIRILLKRNAIWMAAGAILVVGGILTVVLTRGISKKLPKRKTTARYRNDPVTQPVLPRKDGQVGVLPWAQRLIPPSAYLIRLRSDGQPITAPPIPLSEDEIIFGNDPTKATNLLDDPSIAAVHARLIRKDENDFTLMDEDTIAGTWVNYEQLIAPRHLRHGDVIHIGQVSYRFMLRNPPEKPGPRVNPEKK